MKVLVTGGAGYIGSHMVRMLKSKGHEPIVFDNLSTGHRSFVADDIAFFEGDLIRSEDIAAAMTQYQPDAVIHFAASIVVPESVIAPIKYYYNNTVASLNLAKVMVDFGVDNLIVSSTAAVFGEPEKMPVSEDSPTIPTNPYGRSKLVEEMMLRDISMAHDLNFISLRYFNVAGSSPDLTSGIRYEKITHLIPRIMMAASGRAESFTICGSDYPTKDGTCIRDFIYIEDLCRAHLLALEYLIKEQKSDCFNLGSGSGFSVREVYDQSCLVTGMTIPVIEGDRRAGDPSRVVATYEKAKAVLGWEPKADLETIVKTCWDWEKSEAGI